MGKSQETFNKKEKEKKRKQKQQEKAQKKEERKANSDKGKGLDDMMAYVDDDGNISTTPPDPKKKKVIKAKDIEVGIPRQENRARTEIVRNGIVTHFNDSKGYGFIKDLETQESVFVHVNNLEKEIRENDKVTFETERGPKGLNAIKVKIIE